MTQTTIDSVFCLTEALQFYEVPFVNSWSYSTSHCCSIQEFFPCAHIFEAFPHFLLYKFHCLWFYVEFLDPLGLELCTRRKEIHLPSTFPSWSNNQESQTRKSRQELMRRQRRIAPHCLASMACSACTQNHQPRVALPTVGWTLSSVINQENALQTCHG